MKKCKGFPTKWNRYKYDFIKESREWNGDPDPPKKLYHTTGEKRYNKIKKQGLLPKWNKRQGGPDDMPVVWAWESFEKAKSHVGNNGYILEIDVEDKLCWTQNFGGIRESWVTPVKIPPKKIKAIKISK
jgi:hypothetical protein